MFKRILVPTDLTRFSDTAFRVALELARNHGAALHLLHVLPEMKYGMVAQYFPADAEAKAVAESRERLSKEIESHDLGDISCEISVRVGNIYEEVLDCGTDIKADLIVMAHLDRHGVERFLMGSNAEKVVRYAHCSVLVVRH